MMKRIVIAGALIAAGLVSADARLPKEEPTPHYLERAAMFKKEGVKAGTVVFLGDSQTEGGDWAELTGLPDVVNRGIIGDTSEGIAERLSDVTDGKPSKIFLLCGVNDVSHAIRPTSVAMSIIDVVKRIHAESPETKVYLQSLLPINNSIRPIQPHQGQGTRGARNQCHTGGRGSGTRCDVDKSISTFH